MPVSATAVMQLRARTGVSINECKKALEEAGGDEEKAIEILRRRGIATAAKKAGRDQSEGLVFLEQSGNKAAIVTLKCETDFVARDSNFQSVGKAIVKALLEGGAGHRHLSPQQQQDRRGRGARRRKHRGRARRRNARCRSQSFLCPPGRDGCRSFGKGTGHLARSAEKRRQA